MTTPLAGILIFAPETLDLVYGPAELEAIERYVRWVAPPQTRQSIAMNPTLLEDVEVIFSGWGAPVFDDYLLDYMPKLRAIFNAAGPNSLSAALNRGVVVTTAHHANSLPVAEYTFAVIVLSLKHAWELARHTAAARTHVPRNGVPGCYGSTVGLVGMGMIARLLLDRLATLDVRVVVSDPYLSAADALALGVELVSLDELFEISDVVSLHVPDNAATAGMIRGVHFNGMKPGAAFINTARGGVVNEPEMLEVARQRTDLQFILDVSFHEPPVSDSPLYTLPNVFYTPHIAGSAGAECRRMGHCMIDELERFVTGRPLKWALAPAAAPVALTFPVVRDPQFVANGLPRALPRLQPTSVVSQLA